MHVRRPRSLLAWLGVPGLALAASAGICVLVYASFRPGESAAAQWGSFVLYPGVSIYVWLNGSLLFGGGVPAWAEYIVIVGGSTVSWTLLLWLATSTVLRLLRRG